MEEEKIEEIYEHCYPCGKVTEQRKIIEDDVKIFYVCCICKNRKRKWK